MLLTRVLDDMIYHATLLAMPAIACCNSLSVSPRQPLFSNQLLPKALSRLNEVWAG